MLYQRVGIINEVPFSDFLFEEIELPEEESDAQDAMLALTDESGNANVLGDGVLEDSNERDITPQELAQGLEHVQAYEDEQRQEIAAETVEAVMVDGAAPEEAPAQEEIAEETSLEVKPA
jgi:hypothetical protein